MNCLFLSCHASLEYYMARIFQKIDVKIGLSDMDVGNNERPAIPSYRDINNPLNSFTNKKHHSRSWSASDLKGIDFIYMMNYDNVDKVAEYYAQFNIPIIINMFGQYNLELSKSLLRVLKNHAHIHMVVYSITEYTHYLDVLKAPDEIKHRIKLIRFGLDSNLFSNWKGEINKVYTTCNSIHKRGDGCGWIPYQQIIKNIPYTLSGRDTEQVNGLGLLPYEDLITNYKNHRCYLSMGTYPAPFVLNLMEAMLTGMPVVAWDHDCGVRNEKILSSDGTIGLYSKDVSQVQQYIRKALEDFDWAKDQGEKIRAQALNLFNEDTVATEWAALLTTIRK